MRAHRTRRRYVFRFSLRHQPANAAAEGGYVFQNHVLFPHLTAEQNVLYVSAQNRGTRRGNVLGAFLHAGISKTADRYPIAVGGEQQRVALARALATIIDHAPR